MLGHQNVFGGLLTAIIRLSFYPDVLLRGRDIAPSTAPDRKTKLSSRFFFKNLF